MKYFAYGSNMDPQRLEKRKVQFTQRKAATLYGYGLQFNKEKTIEYPGTGSANIVPNKSKKVEGVLYDIPDEDESLGNLDRAEGYPEHHDRRMVYVETVETGSNKIPATAYIAQEKWVKEGLRPHPQYLAHLIAGSDLLSENYRQFLNSFDVVPAKQPQD